MTSNIIQDQMHPIYRLVVSLNPSRTSINYSQVHRTTDHAPIACVLRQGLLDSGMVLMYRVKVLYVCCTSVPES